MMFMNDIGFSAIEQGQQYGSIKCISVSALIR